MKNNNVAAASAFLARRQMWLEKLALDLPETKRAVLAAHLLGSLRPLLPRKRLACMKVAAGGAIFGKCGQPDAGPTAF